MRLRADGFFRTGDLGWLDRKGFPARRRPQQGAAGARRRQEGLPRCAREAVRGLEPVERSRDPRRPRSARRSDRSGRARDPRARHHPPSDAAARRPRGNRRAPAAVSTYHGVSRRSLGRCRVRNSASFAAICLPELYKRAAAAEAAPANSEPTAEDTKLLASERGRAAWQWLVARYPDKQVTLDTSPQLELQIDSLEWVALDDRDRAALPVSLTGEAVSRILTRARSDPRDRDGRAHGGRRAVGCDRASRGRVPRCGCRGLRCAASALRSSRSCAH